MIVPMKRLTLIGLSCEKESTLKALQRLGAVQLISEGELTDSEKLRQLTAKADRLNAMSSSRFLIFEIFIPGAGTISYSVTVGPMVALILVISIL